MKAQGLPINAIVVIALGTIFFISILILFLNVGGLGERIGLIKNSSIGSGSPDCNQLCLQANNFPEGQGSQTAYCVNGCKDQVPCIISDSKGTLINLNNECQ